MAPRKNTAAPAVALGNVLISAIAAAMSTPPGYLFITQEQAGSVDPANINVNSQIVDGDKAAAILTDAGKALAASLASAPAAPAAASPSYEIEDGIAVPTARKRGGSGRKGGYPFEALGVGQSFHVAKTDENPDPANRLASSVTGARVKFSVPAVDANGAPIMEQVNVKTFAKDGSGAYVKGQDGKRVVATQTTELRQKRTQTRDFMVASVGAEDPKGEGARVWRTV